MPQNYLSKCGKPEASAYGFNFFRKPQRLRVTTHEEETALQGIQKLICLFLLPVFQASPCDFRRRQADFQRFNYTSGASLWRCRICWEKVFLNWQSSAAPLDTTDADKRALLPGQLCLHPDWVFRVVWFCWGFFLVVGWVFCLFVGVFWGFVFFFFQISCVSSGHDLFHT